MSKCCFKIYSIYKDTEDIVYIEVESKKEAIEFLKEAYEEKISDFKYLRIE